jgi:hypothetical protein
MHSSGLPFVILRNVLGWGLEEDEKQESDSADKKTE